MNRYSLLLGLLLISACGPQGSGPGALTPTTTWHRDIRPIVDKKCAAECHRSGGIGGVVFDGVSAPAYAKLIGAKVSAGEMPPWPPGPLSVPLADSRALTAGEIAEFVRWAEQPALGNPSDYKAPVITPRFDPGGGPTITALMAKPYAPPPTTSFDELRCFIIDVPTGNVRAYRPRFGKTDLLAYHHAGAQIVSAATAATIRSTLDGKDGRPGWDCAGGTPDALTNFSDVRVAPDTGYVYPVGLGFNVPAGAALVLDLHYRPQQGAAGDKSGMELWYTTDPVSPLGLGGFDAPSEVPCPTGTTSDASSPCSRAYAAAHTIWPGAAAHSQSIVEGCGYKLSNYDLLPFPGAVSSFKVTGTCTKTVNQIGQVGKVVSLGVHAHPNTVAVHVELDQGAGFQPLLDIPRWSWVWEDRYKLVTPISLKASDRLRLTCVYDNGTAAQPSAATHDYGHDQPAAPPLAAPRYQLWDQGKADSMCILGYDVDLR